MRRKLVIMDGKSYWINKEQKKKSGFMKGLSFVGQGAGIVAKNVSQGAGIVAKNVGGAVKDYNKQQAYKQGPEYKKKVLEDLKSQNEYLKQRVLKEKHLSKMKQFKEKGLKSRNGNIQRRNPIDPMGGDFGLW